MVILLLVISLSLTAKSSAYFQDQIPKLVTSENYYTSKWCLVLHVFVLILTP